ncbi:putative glucosamine-6-phosphate isomerase, putative,glucosamine-6-phosphate deaminase [Trypanosoma grayi]|uniref:putative glucosamine-6-phosphate isomerase, putative,glucosamine-6-phosphate deaminase n=1 Tax=Trypanosoma grayi TaxID=71804 RepID=UPI0004F46E07|nr:putative glucosamine-6-phosphate isomerase, putative,glucosamine-6-phosphate deaminase [Trypanosoma grayi]KEG07340.1 putative glucosamine-6-phosphate isomerase, putative,glucosamine-6-phosphate deaminase [Trypanosoma grayi]
MSHVAKMAAIDHHQVRSVAALTVTVLSARYGALQWNRALKELAQGLHRYHSVSPLCRVFRELFIDEASSALEDLFLFCRLQRAAVKHSTVETQKVILPPMETESGAPQSIFQHTIVSRRYLRLRSLTAALSDMLTAVSVPEHREVGVIRVVRKRRLKPAEVVGVKTIVAYWIEEESSKSDSLAFDLGGFVDMHEVLAVVVKALSSAHQQIPVASRGACDPVNRDDVDEESLQKEEKATAVSKARKNNDENEEPLSYAARAHLIMQSRPQQPEGVVRPAQASYRPPPAVVNSVPLSAMSPIRSALQEGIVGTGRVPPTTLHGTSGERHEMFRGVPKSLARVSLQEERPQGYLRKPQNEVKKVAGCTSLHKGGDDAAAHQQGTVSRTEAPTSPGQISAEPVIVNLNHGPGAEIDEAPPQRNATESVNSGCLDSHKYGGGRQAQQYLAALAAIDAELQRRREVLKSTVAFDLSTCDPSRDVPVGPESSARPTERTVLWRDDCDATSATPSVEPTPQRAIGSGELTLSVTAADLEQPIESCEPPANASTFGHTTPPPLPPQHQPNSILLPSKHQSRTKPVEKSGDESSATQSDFEMLTAEERYLLADLRQALSRQK